jgi:hypothetical protein
MIRRQDSRPVTDLSGPVLFIMLDQLLAEASGYLHLQTLKSVWELRG